MTKRTLPSPPRSANARSGWFRTTKASIARGTRPSGRSRPRSAVRGKPCAIGSRKPRTAKARDRVQHRTSASASRRWSAKSASCAKPTKSCARRVLILLLPSSTADRGHDLLHRRAPGDSRGRADLQSDADRPVDVPRARGPAGRPRQAVGTGQERRGADGRDPPRVRRELRRLRGAQGVAAARPRGHRCGLLHGGAPDARHGPAGGRAGEKGPHHGAGSLGSLPARPGEPGVQSTSSQRASGVGFHICRDLVGLRQRKPLSSTCSPAASSAGGHPARLRPASCWTL